MAFGEKRGKENGDILYETGEDFELSRLISGRGRRKENKGETHEPIDVGGVVDTIELDHILNIDYFWGDGEYLRSSLYYWLGKPWSLRGRS